ncbi:hypothetical protein Tco_0533210 [Tanacetum coccineum]
MFRECSCSYVDGILVDGAFWLMDLTQENRLKPQLSEQQLLELEKQQLMESESPNTREQSGQPVMIREEDDRITVALDPQTLSSGFCVSTEWEVVFLGGTTLAEVILVKGHELPNIVKVLPVGFHLSPTSVNT